MAGGKGTIANLQGKVNADNELVVAATVQSGPAVITDGADPAIEATVKDYSNSNPLAVVVMDTNGDPAALAGGTQYAQGSASTDTDTATMAGVVRKDTPAIATGVADGDRTLLSVDSAGLAYTRLRQQLDGDSGAGEHGRERDRRQGGRLGGHSAGERGVAAAADRRVNVRESDDRQHGALRHPDGRRNHGRLG
jgi:hypothetical protein